MDQKGSRYTAIKTSEPTAIIILEVRVILFINSRMNDAARDRRIVGYHYCHLGAASDAGLLVPVLKATGTLLLTGDTLRYPCISWCSAEQKSVQ